MLFRFEKDQKWNRVEIKVEIGFEVEEREGVQLVRRAVSRKE